MASKERRIEALKTLAAETKAELKIKADQLEKKRQELESTYGIKDINDIEDILDGLADEIAQLDKQILKSLDDIENKLEAIEVGNA